MKIISIFLVIICHAILFLAFIDAEEDILLADFSSEGLTERHQQQEYFLPKYPHQSEEYVITVDIGIESDWSFPITHKQAPEIIIEKIVVMPEIIQPLEPKIQPIQTSIEPIRTQTVSSTTQKSANNQQSQKGTGLGNRDAVGKGSGKNNIDGPAGFVNGNSDQTILRNIQRCYPLISRQRGEQGLAIVRIHVDIHGNVARTEIIQSTNFSRLDKCALESVKSLNAKPKIINGKKIPSHFDQSIRFRLN